uniref:Uncharacterized protein n=1 Tax=Cacopsylla melanoneura TaxID=428564 RepID=A0A8D8S2V8_9HEMI
MNLCCDLLQMKLKKKRTGEGKSTPQWRNTYLVCKEVSYHSHCTISSNSRRIRSSGSKMLNRVRCPVKIWGGCWRCQLMRMSYLWKMGTLDLLGNGKRSTRKSHRSRKSRDRARCTLQRLWTEPHCSVVRNVIWRIRIRICLNNIS